MKTSDTIAELTTALPKDQGMIDDASKTSDNSFFFETDKDHIIRLKKGNPILDMFAALVDANEKLAQHMRDEIAKND
jgi:hypothetical protein